MDAALSRLIQHRGYVNFEALAETNDKLETSGFSISGSCEAGPASSSWNPQSLAALKLRRETGERGEATRGLVGVGGDIEEKEDNFIRNERVLLANAPKTGEVLSWANLRALVDYMACAKFYRCLLLTERKLTSSASDFLQASSDRAIVEVFQTPFRNLPDHSLVPRHERLQPDEEVALLKRHSAQRTSFSRILVSDPIARYFAFPAGSLIKVTRKEDVERLQPDYYLISL